MLLLAKRERLRGRRQLIAGAVGLTSQLVFSAAAITPLAGLFRQACAIDLTGNIDCT